MSNVSTHKIGIKLDPQSADPAAPSNGQLQMSDGTARTEGLWQYIGGAWTQIPLSAGATTIDVKTKTTTYTAAASDTCILADATGGAFTITLPAAASNSGQIYYISKIDSTAGAITIDGNASETVDGALTINLDRQYQSVILTNDGSNWFTIHGRQQIDSFVDLHTENGHGSTNTVIRRFTTAVTNQGSAITYADSSTLGATFTINESGMYHMHGVDLFSSPHYCGISVNSTQLTTSILSITTADKKALSEAAAGTVMAYGTVQYLVKDDVVRVHTSGGGSTAAQARANFSIAKIGRV